MQRILIPVVLVCVLFALAGCTASIVIPVAYGSAQICSGSGAIYGDLYVDGRYIGYLEPNGCLFADNLALGEDHVARVYHPWGGVYTRYFYLNYSGQIVTIFP